MDAKAIAEAKQHHNAMAQAEQVPRFPSRHGAFLLTVRQKINAHPLRSDLLAGVLPVVPQVTGQHFQVVSRLLALQVRA